MPGAAGSALLMMFTWAERLAGDATVITQPRSIATSKPSRSTKNSRVSAGRSDLMLGTALLTVTLRVLPHSSDDLPCEGGRVDLARVLELEEESVAARGRELCLEPDGAPAATAFGRVGVQVGEVTFAQRDQVPLGTEVLIDLDGLACAGDVEGELRRTPGA